jgi:hypothetical protein
MRRTFAAYLTALGVVAALMASPAQAQDKPFRILVIDDLTGVYQGNGGPNTVLATTMAAEDFGGKVLVKSSKDSRDPATDLYKILYTVPGATLFTPAEKSGCQSLLSQ